MTQNEMRYVMAGRTHIQKLLQYCTSRNEKSTAKFLMQAAFCNNQFSGSIIFIPDPLITES